jgi:peptide-methionine (S)-S-oxide reductase
MDGKKKPKETATIGGGCFWCTEALFEHIDGIANATSGYSGGFTANPTYEDVCTGQTGHAEVVQIEYDPSIITYEKLLEYFFSSHDPTTVNQQGADIGSQYRSIILYHTEAQKSSASMIIKKLDDSRVFQKKIVTELKPFAVFYPAEKYHQDFYRKNPDYGYCRIVIEPKMKKMHVC